MTYLDISTVVKFIVLFFHKNDYDFTGLRPCFYTSGTSHYPDICVSGATAEEFWYHSILLVA